MAVPVIKGVKSANERFAGALDTYTIEGLMQDGKSIAVWYLSLPGTELCQGIQRAVRRQEQ